MWKVKFFQTARGEYPVKEFVEAQNLTTIAKVGKSVTLLKNYGPFLRPPNVKKIRPNLWELRIHGDAPIRVLYTVVMGEYYLLNAFKKKSQKTPTREIKTALDRARELI